MIYEYAVDPALVVGWALAGAGRFVGQFGMDNRRLVSDFPKEWTGRVYGEFYEHFGYDETSVEFQNAQPRLQAYAQWLSEYMVERSIWLDHDACWLDAAVAEHARRPFHAIMAEASSSSPCVDVITPAVVDDIRDSHWYLPTVKPTAKSANAIAAVLGPFLRMARSIVLVDPYFDADEPRFVATFRAIVCEAVAGRGAGRVLPQVTIITGVEQAHKAREGEFTREQKNRVADDLRVKAIRDLPVCLPRGMTADFYCLAHPEGGDPLHNRWILTDVGGVVLPYGTDDYLPGESHGAIDDLQPMLKGLYEARWSQYARRKGVEVVLGPVRIEGRG